ncbi:MAG TPA: hypothetical protein VFG45_09100 [Candidatus Nitrosocosmicus sp.]|jgi:hypothetical protein|uniref:hypothetical protein n=1 Tax=Candidatus Nitrosocosmicus agrestis TaxID=2563600 RepID=UPI00122E4293|nr:hypothetical protein [Candidatus Nitrosocosmicus sp. SS]KAA2283281.1 hypothetical protein F1Z66_01920 [Candidatus Nitrosocosmicus sp. SS]KAF0868471.1 hypothetical protein E5N71_10320 [Candidatus Nitrosocosmicus sp. SS]MDR4491870.1 hypothetical protein [Candidatus Nitrosocosmicus sp.]HET6590307.1 hypothetical protein [Candidatus Nitrosocosmicus sp.]
MDPNGNGLNDPSRSRWTIEITPLFNQDKVEHAFKDKYSIVRKTFVDEKLIESENIIVSRKNLLQLKDKIESILNECM